MTIGAPSASAGPATGGAWRLSVRGVVQGVGFRPFVHRLAQRFHMGGWVRNEAGTVEIVLAGSSAGLSDFLRALRAEAPPLARIDELAVVETNVEYPREFRIGASRDDQVSRQPISPDVATCAECERELYDRSNRRAGYPFITCTDCGPRHSVILGMPYDRELTTMRAFRQCPECRREYEDIGNRRYHSETNACAACGPSVRLLIRDAEARSGEPIADAARLLCDGAIVAVRGIGGFHLAADATSDGAVRRLRERKHRDGKPLAVMVRSIADARELACISDAEAAWLVSPQRPIVVLERRPGSCLAPAVSDHLPTVGLMLAYSPLHMLLLDELRRPCVMTSGNSTNLPLAVTLEEAQATLGGIADAFLTHDRAIAEPIDDSVVRIVDGEPVLMRRARGFAPLPLSLPIPAPVPLIAVGAHLKNTFTLADGSDAFVSQHIGDLETIETMQHWERSVASFSRMLRVQPRVAVRDMHPEYLSTQLGERLAPGRTIVTQHHHAHVVAVMAEHGVATSVVGIAFDGTGLGDDGHIWGGEFLVANLLSYRRAGHLRYAPLPGGDVAARQGWRAAIGLAHIADDDSRLIERALGGLPGLAIARQQCERRVNAPLSSSMGRLFDAAAAILGICRDSRFEGEAAMRLEAAAGARTADPLPMPIRSAANGFMLDPTPLLTELARAVLAGEDRRYLAAAFHETVVHASAALATRIAQSEMIDTVALGGGVFQNARLLSGLRTRLAAAGLRVLTARMLPPNDGGLSYGQAAIAAARLAPDTRWL